jgi:hypothetical protein
MKSNISHNIKHRKTPNNEFYTPRDLAKNLFREVPIKENDIVMDNAYGTGNFYFRGLKSKDFLNDNRKVDWYITNPPYSFLDEWLKKSCEAKKGFAYLLTIHNLTPRRIEMCEKLGFGITKIHLCKVFKWYGISAFIIWEKHKKGIINYDRKVWK